MYTEWNSQTRVRKLFDFLIQLEAELNVETFFSQFSFDELRGTLVYRNALK